MIDLHLIRSDPSAVAAALARRGVEAKEIEDIADLDVVHRGLLQRQESLRAEVKSLSKDVGAAKKSGDEAKATALMERSRLIGDEEREAAHEADVAGAALHTALLRSHDGGQEKKRAKLSRPTANPSGFPTGRSARNLAFSIWNVAQDWLGRCSRSTGARERACFVP